jgi:hypothetical protein
MMERFRSLRALYYYFQKSIRHLPVRRMAAAAMASMAPATTRDKESPIALGLLSSGWAPLEKFLTEERAREIREYFEPKLCSDQLKPWEPPSFPWRRAPEACRKATYGVDTLLDAPGLVSLANDPRILQAVAAVLRCKPTITRMEAWWSLPKPVSGDPAQSPYKDDLFHRDVDDFAFIKLFVYLTNVDKGAGPHVFVKGSHFHPELTRRGAIADHEVKEVFGQENISVITGKAGTAFLEDTFGIHKGLPPTQTERLIFSVTYSLTSLNPTAPSRPLRPLPPGLDPYVNRVYFTS